MGRCASKKLSGKEQKGFLKNNIFIILAFLIPAAIMAAAFVVSRFYPFGNKMIMVVDSWHQYYPFMAEYQRMLKEGSSVMYSWNAGGGANFLGIIANYLGSPLYLLSALIPSGTPWLPAFLAATVVVRVGIAGMSFAIFLRKVFRRNDLSLVTFSLMYAFCAYIIGYYWNMMWLDTVALMPLVVAGTVGVLRDKKFALYLISLALSVICSFYIGYMVCLFVLIFSIGYTIVSFVSLKESFKNAGRMFLYTAVALMLTAVITIPAYKALQISDSAADAGGITTTKLILNYAYSYKEFSLINMLMAIARTATNMLAYTRPIVFKEGLPNIACGVLSLVLVFFYITNRKIRLKERIVSSILCIFFLLSFVLNHLNYIWHAFATPAMVYYRWSFIFSFFILVLAYRAYTFIDTVGKRQFIVASGLFALYIAAAFFLQRKISVLITCAGAAVILLGIILYRKRKLSKKIFSLLLCLFVICEMGLSAYLGVRTVRSTKMEDYPRNEKEVNELLAVSAEGSSGELVRTEFLNSQTLNDPALNGVYGISTFNSMVNSRYSEVFEDIGLAASVGNNRYEYTENTPVVHALLSMKYIIARDSEQAYSKYLKPVATADECILYENTVYVPSGFMTDSKVLDYPEDSLWSTPLHVQNGLLTDLTGINKNVFEFVEPESEASCEYSELMSVYRNYDHCYDINLKDKEAPKTTEKTTVADTTSTKISTSDEEGLPLIVEYEVPEDGEYYGYFRSTTVEDGYVTISSYRDNPRVISTKFANSGALGELKKGDRIEVVLNVKYGKKSRVAYYLAKISEDVLSEATEILRENTMTLTEKTDRGIKGSINVNKPGLFFTSVLYDKGWKAYVDGKEVEITPYRDTFIAFELGAGEHTIELRFTSEGTTTGVCVTFAGIALFALLLVVSKKKKHSKEAEIPELPKTDAFSEAEPQGSDLQENCTETET